MATKKTSNVDKMSALMKAFEKSKAVKYRKAPEEIGYLSTGSLIVDAALGGGFPRGAITELFGPNNTGKTTLIALALSEAIWEAHDRDMYCFYVNSENRPIDGLYWINLGLPYERHLDRTTGEITYECSLKDANGVPRLQIFESRVAEDALNTVLELVESGIYVAGAIDSIAALVPKGEVETDMNKNTQLGLQARMMARFNRVLSEPVRASQIVLLCANHYRVKMDAGMYENKGTSSGGNHFHHASSLRLETYRLKSEWESDDVKKHLRMDIRFYIRKTSVGENNGRLNSFSLDRNPDTGAYSIDPALEALIVGKEMGIFRTRKDEPWRGQGYACVDVLKLGYNNTAYDENENGHIEIGTSYESITEALRKDVDLLVAVEDAIRSKIRMFNFGDGGNDAEAIRGNGEAGTDVEELFSSLT